MMEESKTIEDIAADALNGVMICLLALCFPAFFVWQAFSRWGSWTLDLSLRSLLDAGPVVFLTLSSLLFLRTGARLVQRSLTAFQRRSRSQP